MSRRPAKRTKPTLELIPSIFIAGNTLLVVLLFVPVWNALQAGLASLSVLIFGGLTLLSLSLAIFGRSSYRKPLVVASSIAFIGFTVPQVEFLKIASDSNAQLSFNVRSYVHFSGKADIPPTREYIYKTVNSTDLRLAYYKSSTHNKNTPVVVLLHGGAWRYGDHLETGQWPRVLTNAGFAVFSAQYRLASDNTLTWQQSPADVKDAVTYISQQSDRLGLDTEKIHLLGQSAGGHLALLEAYSSNSVASVVSLYAPVDLEADYRTSRDKTAELDFIGGPPGQYPERYEALSPLNYIKESSPPTLIIQGMTDDLVHPSQAVALSEALRSKKVPYTLLLLPRTGHSFENQRGGFATQIVTERIIEFLK